MHHTQQKQNQTNLHYGKNMQKKAKRLTVTHNSVPRSFSNMEIIRPSRKIGHVEGHVKLKQTRNLRTHKVVKYTAVKRKKKKVTVSVRWSRLTFVKRRRSLQQNLRIVVILKKHQIPKKKN